jgi:hypothetical protein
MNPLRSSERAIPKLSRWVTVAALEAVAFLALDMAAGSFSDASDGLLRGGPPRLSPTCWPTSFR